LIKSYEMLLVTFAHSFCKLDRFRQFQVMFMTIKGSSFQELQENFVGLAPD